uniref:HD domain-containing protein n=1 Tax=Chromera velia CCMP2878 TaxID=1169474 RepID=A0A0G4G2S7_9ALVE|eukprot:Cvel_4082.t1-p1 / transcript=Cvel_4082.t1 / gene=Cvel_4082 / organism=Chromera_velia_CCMP2878 / gene_product=HD domain-containing protein 2 homolog, putative / transcript_product=HD domain-containing protein 2 homolog, putative / location=Cvel_scaffold174:1225-1983(+) / protein_length=253 / sequence_SO=supercontig / SO=protein_coding / is_pseudo=false
MEDKSPNGYSCPQMDSLFFVSEICGALKKIKRTGWLRCQVPLPESDSDHMHRCAMCALLLTQPADPRDDYSHPDTAKFHPSKVDTTRLLKMAVSHDLCEALASDITPFCDPKKVASKHETEERAMQEIRKVVGDPLGKDLYELWHEYEAQETVEALYCKDIDKFEMVVQAYEYEEEHLKDRKEIPSAPDDPSSHPPASPPVTEEPLRTFFMTTNKTMKSPLFKRLDRDLREKREKMLTEKGWEVTEQERQQPQ